ncbi:hypothetical protein [Dyadobacter sp. CY356]|uniref:hypothetical protein n=1 Tax=Dyadobacter sp. CY356 TaxID=2906442 RepID=UPI001F2B2119|nr:hypothetical protein [Dyadobacter sp. CY356]
MAKNTEKLITVIFVLFFISIISCKKSSGYIEPVIENGGKIVSSNKWQGQLDTGFVTLSYNQGKVNGLVIHLRSQPGAPQFSTINILYTDIPENTQRIPEGEFVLHGEDSFHYSINDDEDFGAQEKDLKFSLVRISNNRYSITFSGMTSTGKSITGFYINDLAMHDW